MSQKTETLERLLAQILKRLEEDAEEMTAADRIALTREAADIADKIEWSI